MNSNQEQLKKLKVERKEGEQLSEDSLNLLLVLRFHTFFAIFFTKTAKNSVPLSATGAIQSRLIFFFHGDFTRLSILFAKTKKKKTALPVVSANGAVQTQLIYFLHGDFTRFFLHFSKIF